MLKIKLMPDEKTLLEKISRGDQHAFSIVFYAYQKKLYSSAYRMLKDEMLAEEVVQESLLKIWVMGEQLSSVKNLESYLLKISRNKAFDLLRRKELQRKAEHELHTGWKEDHNETEEQLLLQETKKILQDGINALPDQQKIVYQLCHQEGLKYEEVALKLNLSIETIRSYMRLAQRSLRKYMRKHGNISFLLILLKLL